MIDLDALRYFLSLEITRSVTGIVVHQTKYARDLLIRFGMLSAKPYKTSLILKSSK